MPSQPHKGDSQLFGETKITSASSPSDEQEVSLGQPELAFDAVQRRSSSARPVTINSRVLALVVAAAGLGLWIGYSSPIQRSTPPVATVASPVVPVVEAPTSVSTFSPTGFSTGTTQTTIPLQLINTYPVPQEVRAQIEPVYKEWEQAHGEGAARVDHLISLYAPDAQIYQLPGQLLTVAGLRSLAVQMRNIGRYISVEDKNSVKWARNSDGDEVEMLADQRYGHEDGSHTLGQRRLVWKKLHGKWKIIRDDFPPTYTPES